MDYLFYGLKKKLNMLNVSTTLFQQSIIISLVLYTKKLVKNFKNRFLCKLYQKYKKIMLI